MIKFIIKAMCLLLMPVNQIVAQDVEMAEGFRADGKIYVVILVASIVFLGIFLFLIFLDRKLRKIEKELENKNMN